MPVILDIKKFTIKKFIEVLKTEKEIFLNMRELDNFIKRTEDLDKLSTSIREMQKEGFTNEAISYCLGYIKGLEDSTKLILVGIIKKTVEDNEANYIG
jgi:hypothetical protein